MSTILVTGASTGIGQEAALHMARKGNQVYAAVRNPDGVDDLRKAIAAESLPVTVVQMDITQPESIDSAIAQIMAETGSIDALVNNAGVGAGQAVEMTSMEDVRWIFETNYFGTVNVLRAVTPIMRKQGSGRIVNVGSLAGRVPMGCHAHYSASKFAMEGLSESLAFEMAEFNVKVSIIEPGCVLTPIWGKAEPMDESIEQPYMNTLMRLGRWFEFNLGRPAMPADVATAIEDAIDSDTPRFRYPVGADAEEMIAARAKVSDEEWIKANCLQGEAHDDRMLELVGKDYYR
ncbi:SDR family oxidoreductase [Halioglobus maricola]|uniref:SDR family oxidoreductase n=1 Tax=Halioglobus maricola TaxID=2601894 RepID=A0A5P9NHX5_9GAMM|nr:SDR family oxidoreductase [Halioglobus maricola]QFU75135.1 SDR family oxidoreductase [Halioglobus maricola]